ncbi:ABC transporter permease [Streptacidiphilus sp. ASG 303]|uniref:ABC transporter permease n=1 Tax=Streptacidiphilus sp. ASG 303 TaxID=2896847 RepID=UPI001E3D5BD0|nr:ABC transporter permease [Streptacidiphilus sp. ASG 303]MCD0481418.1 ABC transporter permease [Streptacidiphilus sp. ASG 303]
MTTADITSADATHAPVPAAALPAGPSGGGPGARLAAAWRTVRRSRRLSAGLALIALFLLTAAVGPLLATDPQGFGTDLSQPPSGAHWLGTTQTGQDVFDQLMVSTRTSLLIGFAAALAATAISVVIGIGGGFLGGWSDEALSLLSNVFLVIPGLPLVIVISSYTKGGSLLATIGVIAFTSWAASARVLRAQTLSLRTRDYVLAARLYGERRWRIVLVEILPNEAAIIVSQFIFAVIFAILTQAGLAFLGLQNPSDLTWGNMLYFAQNADALSGGAWWWFVPPGLCIAVFGAAMSLVSFGLDEVLDPRLRVYRPARRGRAGRQRTAPRRTAPQQQAARRQEADR